MRLFLSLLSFCVLSTFAGGAAAIYKCQNPNGKVEYQDKPCPEGDKASTANLPRTEAERMAIYQERRLLREKQEKAWLEERILSASQAPPTEWDERRSKLLPAVRKLKVGDNISNLLGAVDPNWRDFVTPESISESGLGQSIWYSADNGEEILTLNGVITLIHW